MRIKPTHLSFLKRASVIGIMTLMVAGCASYKPSNTTNLCSIFQGSNSWYKDAKASNKRWGTPIPVMMAIMQQESNFKDDARPGYKYFLGIIPTGRISSAYGYSQAQDGTWSDYKKSTRRWRASRSDIYDALDFIGWYNHQSHKRLKISHKDTYKLYLAYHEGQGGYSRQTYLKKPWLLKVAKKVSNRSRKYQKQYHRCS